MLVLAHLSDTHLDGTAPIADRARAAVRYLEALPYDLDAVLVTGDIADHGLPEEYEEAREILASRHPVLVCPGNHDVRAPFREVLLKGVPVAGGPDDPVNQVHRTPNGVIALCDSSIPGRDDGLLDDGTLAWLADVLAGTPGDLPVLIAFHHPPATLHAPPVDGIRQFGADRLEELVSRHPRVAALLCGHAHTGAATTFAGRPLLVAPGIKSTLLLPWEYEADSPDSDVCVDLRLPPALAFHVLDDSGRLTTHFRVLA